MKLKTTAYVIHLLNVAKVNPDLSPSERLYLQKMILKAELKENGL